MIICKQIILLLLSKKNKLLAYKFKKKILQKTKLQPHSNNKLFNKIPNLAHFSQNRVHSYVDLSDKCVFHLLHDDSMNDFVLELWLHYCLY